MNILSYILFSIIYQKRKWNNLGDASGIKHYIPKYSANFEVFSPSNCNPLVLHWHNLEAYMFRVWNFIPKMIESLLNSVESYWTELWWVKASVNLGKYACSSTWINFTIYLRKSGMQVATVKNIMSMSFMCYHFKAEVINSKVLFSRQICFFGVIVVCTVPHRKKLNL